MDKAEWTVMIVGICLWLLHIGMSLSLGRTKVRPALSVSKLILATSIAFLIPAAITLLFLPSNFLWVPLSIFVLSALVRWIIIWVDFFTRGRYQV